MGHISWVKVNLSFSWIKKKVYCPMHNRDWKKQNYINIREGMKFWNNTWKYDIQQTAGNTVSILMSISSDLCNHIQLWWLCIMQYIVLHWTPLILVKTLVYRHLQYCGIANDKTLKSLMGNSLPHISFFHYSTQGFPSARERASFVGSIGPRE